MENENLILCCFFFPDFFPLLNSFDCRGTNIALPELTQSGSKLAGSWRAKELHSSLKQTNTSMGFVPVYVKKELFLERRWSISSAVQTFNTHHGLGSMCRTDLRLSKEAAVMAIVNTRLQPTHVKILLIPEHLFPFFPTRKLPSLSVGLVHSSMLCCSYVSQFISWAPANWSVKKWKKWTVFCHWASWIAPLHCQRSSRASIV